jgi:predicted DNA-binding transcriptional regulator YafY
VSVRTIYRDIQALSEAGVPVIGSTGIGYSLMEKYFLPPVNFTVEEALTLLIGADFVEMNFDSDLSKMALASRRKIEAILPEHIREKASKSRKTFELLDTSEVVTDMLEREFLRSLRTAIADERKVWFRYSKGSSGVDGNLQSERTVDPYGLLYVQGAWLLVAHCNLRDQIRHFRVSRMNHLVLLEDKFQFPSGFNLQDYETSDDRNMKVLEPEVFRKLIRDEAEQILKGY